MLSVRPLLREIFCSNFILVVATNWKTFFGIFLVALFSSENLCKIFFSDLESRLLFTTRGEIIFGLKSCLDSESEKKCLHKFLNFSGDQKSVSRTMPIIFQIWNLYSYFRSVVNIYAPKIVSDRYKGKFFLVFLVFSKNWKTIEN